MAAKNKALQAVGEVISHKATLEILEYGFITTNKFAKESGANTLLAKAAGVIGNGVNDLLNSPTIIDNAKDALGIETRGLDQGVIQVQYNPASIKYSGNVPQEKTNNLPVNVNGKKMILTTVSSTSTINMSFSLVFHSKYTTDPSVKEQMEYIMNMLSQTRLKVVRFSWANMVATGKLVSFSGKYDMFDLTGNPTSGHMDLTIRMETTEAEVRKWLEAAQEDRDNEAVNNEAVK
jgi:hypothetical protein